MGLKEDALRYHEFPRPGKLEVVPSKPSQTQRDLSLAYSPGVAEPCRRIAENPEDVYRYTNKGNLVAVISNGTAVLGLGDIGPAASKPVMEGKGLLFKRFAGIDVFDIEVNASDPEEFIAAVKTLEPTFGGINLEDIAAPAAFEIEQRLSDALDIPVFHDDQHGTAIIVCAALINALELQDKEIGDVKLVIAGAGAAAMAIARLLFDLGLDSEKTLMTDSRGVIHPGRDNLNKYKKEFARETDARLLEDAMKGADVLVGVSVGDTVSQEMVASMAERPIVMALANPDPEIPYPDAKAVRDDLIMATGRSDYPNQVNNVLGFPFLFRGALDARARSINTEMKIGAVHALARLAREPVPERVLQAYGVDELEFGPEYIIPKPLDPRVLLMVAPAVARAAVESGAARTAIEDWDEYDSYLKRIQGPAYAWLEPMRLRLKAQQRRVAFPEGANGKVIQAAARLVNEANVQAVLVGGTSEIQKRARDINISLDKIEIHDPDKEGRLETYAREFWELRRRKGVTLESARNYMLNPFYYTAMMLEHGSVEAVVSGINVPYQDVVRPALRTLGTHEEGVVSGVYALAFNDRLLFLADCTINIEPTAEEIAAITFQTARVARAFGVEPKVALLSFSSFGSATHPRVSKMQDAVERIKDRNPDFQVDGELQANVAMDVQLRDSVYPFCEIDGEPNVLIFPDLQSGNIAYNLLSTIGGATAIGPILVGVKGAYAALRMGPDVDTIVNMSVITAAAAADDHGDQLAPEPPEPGSAPSAR